MPLRSRLPWATGGTLRAISAISGTATMRDMRRSGFSNALANFGIIKADRHHGGESKFFI